MMLSKETIAALVDLIENKLNMMHIGDRDDLREMVTLKRALGELHGVAIRSEAATARSPASAKFPAAAAAARSAI